MHSTNNTTTTVHHGRTEDMVTKAILEQRICTLEQLAARVTAESLDHQIVSVLQRGRQVVDGPDTREHFEEFSIDTVSRELQ